jgi:hypothetical protein
MKRGLSGIFLMPPLESINYLITSQAQISGIMPELIKRKCKNPNAIPDEQDRNYIAESKEDIHQGRACTTKTTKSLTLKMPQKISLSQTKKLDREIKGDAFLREFFSISEKINQVPTPGQIKREYYTR